MIKVITNPLCGWAIEDTVSRAISQRVDEITHRLQEWIVEETVRTISHQISKISHRLCGWKLEESVSRATSSYVAAHSKITHFLP